MGRIQNKVKVYVMLDSNLKAMIDAALASIKQQNPVTQLIAAQLLNVFYMSLLMRRLNKQETDDYSRQVLLKCTLDNWQEFIKLLEGQVCLSPEIDPKYWDDLFSMKSNKEDVPPDNE